MDEIDLFKKICSIFDLLLGPNGSSWEKNQTLHTLRTYLFEESCELVDAIDHDENDHICDELGDIFLSAVFIGKVAEREGRFALKDALQRLVDKFERRHLVLSHTDGHTLSEEEIDAHWQKVKKDEEIHKKNSGLFANIPSTLPSLLRAQKLIEKLENAGLVQELNVEKEEEVHFSSEDAFGKWLFEQVQKAQNHGIHAELALRKACSDQEKSHSSIE